MGRFKHGSTAAIALACCVSDAMPTTKSSYMCDPSNEVWGSKCGLLRYMYTTCKRRVGCLGLADFMMTLMMLVLSLENVV